jgi:membrane associated rhomboid family serine protease
MFLLPLELKRPTGSREVGGANCVLIALNVLVFLLGWSCAVGPGSGPVSILLYGFSHFNLWHLVGNLWALWIFGNPVNRRLGEGRYLLAYLGTILAIGFISRLCCPGLCMGASGAVFAVMTIAMILLPAARLEVVYLAFFPITLLIGLVAPPKRYWLHWFLRWGMFGLRMAWCLILIPLMLLGELLLGGLLVGVWNWGTTAHLLGVICGVAIVLMLPTRITMPGRVAQGAL